MNTLTGFVDFFLRTFPPLSSSRHSGAAASRGLFEVDQFNRDMQTWRTELCLTSTLYLSRSVLRLPHEMFFAPLPPAQEPAAVQIHHRCQVAPRPPDTQVGARARSWPRPPAECGRLSGRARVISIRH